MLYIRAWHVHFKGKISSAISASRLLMLNFNFQSSFIPLNPAIISRSCGGHNTIISRLNITSISCFRYINKFVMQISTIILFKLISIQLESFKISIIVYCNVNYTSSLIYNNDIYWTMIFIHFNLFIKIICFHSFICVCNLFYN